MAEGSQPDQRRVQQLHAGQSYRLGRSSDADFVVDWDPFISRVHVTLECSAESLAVVKDSQQGNPLFFDGRRVECCDIVAGDVFVLGTTSFCLQRIERDAQSSQDAPVTEVTFDRQRLKHIRFQDADKQIEVLTQLPDVIWGSRTDVDLHYRLVNLMLAGVARAEAVAIVKLDANNSVVVQHWDRRDETAGEFRPSERLVSEALNAHDKTVLHVWEPANRTDSDYTAVAEFDWAYCTPVPEPARPWGIYVAGRDLGQHSATPSRTMALHADVKFAELVAQSLSSVRRLNTLERQHAGLRQFFAPPILAALGDDLDTDLLEPRECDATVLFCDLRGFSQQAEHGADDLTGLLERVSGALGVMAHHILDHGGVTSDFQGDAALGFWGWPFESEHALLNACRTALAIRRAFDETNQQSGHPLADFEVGIGIAHGRAVAGKIGTAEQVKVTVFGPVVNLASRLEGMTSQLRVPILLDEHAAESVRNLLDDDTGRLRRLAKVVPLGMEKPVIVSELLPPAAECPQISDTLIEEYERGVDHFIEGRWEQAYQCLHDMPADDRAQDFLLMLLAQHNRVAPPDWDGIVRLAIK